MTIINRLYCRGYKCNRDAWEVIEQEKRTYVFEDLRSAIMHSVKREYKSVEIKSPGKSTVFDTCEHDDGYLMQRVIADHTNKSTAAMIDDALSALKHILESVERSRSNEENYRLRLDTMHALETLDMVISALEEVEKPELDIDPFLVEMSAAQMIDRAIACMKAEEGACVLLSDRNFGEQLLVRMAYSMNTDDLDLAYWLSWNLMMLAQSHKDTCSLFRAMPIGSRWLPHRSLQEGRALVSQIKETHTMLAIVLEKQLDGLANADPWCQRMSNGQSHRR